MPRLDPAPAAAPRTAYAAWISVCVVWGTTYLAIRIALETIPPALVGGLRFTAAGAILLVFLRARGVVLPGPSEWAGLALLGFLMLFIGNGAVIWAQQWVPTGLAAVLVAAQPFWIAGIESVLPNGERLVVQKLAGLLIGFSGILVLVWPDLTADGEPGARFTIGVLAIQLACLGWSLGSVYSKRRPPQENAIAASAFQMLFGGVWFLAIATLRGEWTDLMITPRTFAAEAYLVVFGSFAGYSAYIYALKHLPITTVSLYSYVNPVIAVLLGSLLLDEPFGTRIVIGSSVVLLGVAIVRTARGAPAGRTMDRAGRPAALTANPPKTGRS